MTVAVTSACVGIGRRCRRMQGAGLGQRHGGGQELRMRVITFRDQIAGADVEKESREQRQRRAEGAARQRKKYS